MKTLLFMVSLATAVMALPAVAQQGPAGVPGAPGLAPPPPPPVVVAPPMPAAKPSESTPARCGKTKTGQAGKPCKTKKSQPANCSSAADPARCEQYRKTRELCKNLPDRDYRQCLRDNLTTKK